jgi:hypothetical protein
MKCVLSMNVKWKSEFLFIYFHLEMFELSRINKVEEDQFFNLSCFLRRGCGYKMVSFSVHLWLD